MRSLKTRIFVNANLLDLFIVHMRNRRMISNGSEAPRKAPPANQQRGFILISLAMAMIVVGLLVSGYAAGEKVKRAERNQEVNPERLATISAALEQYRAENGFYPCPAQPSAPVGTLEHGQAGDCAAPWSMSGFGCDSDGVCVKAGRLYDHDDNPSTDPVPMRVREGAIPTTALNLPSSVAGDTYGRQFRYAVPEVLAVDKPTYSKYEGLGGIDVVTDADVSALDTPESTRFAVFGFGADGRGGYVYGTGRAYLPCIADRMDSINCDKDNNAKAVYRIANRAVPSDITAPEYFDDFIEWQKPKAAAAAAAVALSSFVSDSGECPEGYEVAYSGRKITYLSTYFFKSGCCSRTTRAVPYVAPICVASSALRYKSGGIVSESGTAALPNNTAPLTQTNCVNGVAASWGCVGAANACAVCVPSTN